VSARAVVRLVMMTVSPRSANRCATARPSPLLPPMMIEVVTIQ
jgi:hypothetical protein